MLWATLLGLLVAVIWEWEVAESRAVTVKNNCGFTIWCVVYTDPNINGGNVKLDQPTGWEAPAGSSVTFNMPSNWTAGMIWGRRECNFSGSSQSSSTSCVSGACPGGLVCTSPGVPPITKAEFTLSSQGDFYDVSMTDGFNLPIQITNNQKCPVASCPVDLNAACPSQLKGGTTQDGSTASCKSSCFANLDGKQGDSPNCCTGNSSTPNSCSQAGVQFFDYFKGRCPNGYAYAYDDSALVRCGASNTDYIVTFCP
ncbi:Osmotin, thaumatin-like protein [Marasmius fiardii PR-910]|nr:Osmotin, thaumatin-like protein [Marasmius fiardii PR-910]